MKTGFIIFILFQVLSVKAQQTLELSLQLGSTYNDHSEKKFSIAERKWILSNNTLIYYVDAHDMRYSDTLAVTEATVNTIMDFIRNKGLTKNIDLRFSGQYSQKFEYNEFIKGCLKKDGSDYKWNVYCDALGGSENDSDVKKLKELEQLFYKMVENKKP